LKCRRSAGQGSAVQQGKARHGKARKGKTLPRVGWRNDGGWMADGLG